MNDIIEKLNLYKPINDQEIEDKKIFLKLLNTIDDILTRKNNFYHLTASAFVVNEDFTKALMVHHNTYGGFIYPGGHAYGEINLLKVAKREVEEETGINGTPLTEEIYSIQALAANGHMKKGKYISAHIDLDILYLFQAKNEDMKKIRIKENENSQVKWINLEDTYNEDIVSWIRPINKKIVEKIKKEYNI